MPTTGLSVERALELVADDRTDVLLKSLSSKTRREILVLLAAGVESEAAACCGANEVCALTFARVLGVSSATISHHMKVLTDAGLVSAEKRGLWAYYRLKGDPLSELGQILNTLAACAALQAGCETEAGGPE